MSAEGAPHQEQPTLRADAAPYQAPMQRICTAEPLQAQHTQPVFQPPRAAPAVSSMTQSILCPSEVFCSAQPLGWAKAETDSRRTSGMTARSTDSPPHTPTGQRTSSAMSQQQSSPQPHSNSPTPQQQQGNTSPQPPTMTPWYPTGVPQDGVCLEEELYKFNDLMSLTPEEEAERKNVAKRLQTICQPFWPQCRVQIYGSLAYGLSNPESAIDVVVELCHDPAPFEKMLQKAEDAGFQISGAFVGDGEWYAKLFAPDLGVPVCVSFIKGRSRALQVVSTINRLREQYPSVAPAYSVVRTLLRQSKCGDAVTGGLPSYAALLMLFKLVRRGPPPGNPDALLTDFLTTFGGDCPMPVVGGPESEAPTGWDPRQLWVTDPLDSGNNIANGCSKLHQVRAVFRHCACSLEKWAEQQAYSPHRRRTALSSVIAMRALWARAGGQPPAVAAPTPQPPLLTGSPNAPHARSTPVTPHTPVSTAFPAPPTTPNNCPAVLSPQQGFMPVVAQPASPAMVTATPPSLAPTGPMTPGVLPTASPIFLPATPPMQGEGHPPTAEAYLPAAEAYPSEMLPAATETYPQYGSAAMPYAPPMDSFGRGSTPTLSVSQTGGPIAAGLCMRRPDSAPRSGSGSGDVTMWPACP